ncbi:MAG: heavy metal translocating P-type ATPase [Atopobiaceae bacterium]|jgi:Cd2+/Zn2+-exporting ATPase|nr:heavy metal translocating P-type ATPase [Atopobiaceae bacterium]
MGESKATSCNCKECESKSQEEQKDPKKLIRRIIFASILLVSCMVAERLLDLPMWERLLMYLVPFLVAGYDVLGEAAEGIMHGDPFDESFLMSVATIGALAIGFLPDSEPEFAEAVFVMLFFQVGEAFETVAEGNSRRSIAKLMDIRPDTANVERAGKVSVVSPTEVAIGEIVVVKPGEKIPMDGSIVEGTSSLDTVALTGESVPRSVSVGDSAISGCVNQTGVLRIRVTKPFGESTASKILDLIENAGEHKSRSEHFITRFAHIYTPLVVFSAIALAIVPPLVSGQFSETFPTWLLRALTFLVVSCPCALVVSVPLTFFGGIGSASKSGILIKGSNFLETLAKADTVVFDKTGTLTRGVFQVMAVHDVACDRCGAYAHGRSYQGLQGCDEDEQRLLHLAAHVERFSTHPIADALRAAYPHENDGCTVEDAQEVAGQGVIARVNGHKVAVGNTRLMDAVGAQWIDCDKVGTIVYVAVDGTYAGHIVISDEVKKDAAEAIEGIRSEGVHRTVMLTGDREEVAASVAHELGIDEWHAGLLPADKVEQVEKLLAQRKDRQALAFVGDGINDAPVLARADVGIAMGAMGSDAAIEAADVVLMDDKPSKIARAIQISRRTLRIARQNIVLAVAIKIAILILAAMGLAPMWLAVFGDVGVLIMCVLNVTRTLI